MSLGTPLKSSESPSEPSRVRLALGLLRRLPLTLRGFDFSRKWKPGAAAQAPPPSSGCGAASGSSNPLKSYFDSHEKGRGIWKWEHYFDIYHRHFSKFVGREVHVLEIGIYSGGSLGMWEHYFGPQCRVYGVDIEPACTVYESQRTRIFIGDQADRAFWKTVRERAPAIDIVIDDGGHEPEQQIVSLEEMLPHLRPGGVYLCEDVHGTGNWFTAYVQGLVQTLNDLDRSSEADLTFDANEFQACVHSIHFYPYVTVIEKTDRPVHKFVSLKRGTEWQPFLK